MLNIIKKALYLYKTAPTEAERIMAKNICGKAIIGLIQRAIW